jgi:hypothetical protein
LALTDDQVIVGVAAVVEVEPAQAPLAEQHATMNSMLVPCAWWPVSLSTLALRPSATGDQRRAPVRQVRVV